MNDSIKSLNNRLSSLRKIFKITTKNTKYVPRNNKTSTDRKQKLDFILVIHLLNLEAINF